MQSLSLIPSQVWVSTLASVVQHWRTLLAGCLVLLKPIALRMIYEVAQELRLSYPQVPVIGIGGISNANDALEFIMAGATAIQIGTVDGQ
jgi:dihydroorotate dehydrogenase